MALHFLDEQLWFPPAEEALEDGRLAIGGDLQMDRLLLAYRSGIFPWFNDDELPMWWCPDPRFVLFPDDLVVSKSIKQVIRQNRFDFRINTTFERVVRGCQKVRRKGQDGTWITDEILRAYSELNETGYAISAEAWLDGRLAGGLYGVQLGEVFFGESMFSLVPNASKFAFINLVQYLQSLGVVLIDCQVYTEHLESLGARMIPRKQFLELVAAQAG